MVGQEPGNTRVSGDRVDAHIGMTVVPILHATFEFAVRISRSSSGRPPSASMGACRNFASRAAYSSTASLSGASVMRTTIQLMSDAGWSTLSA